MMPARLDLPQPITGSYKQAVDARPAPRVSTTLSPDERNGAFAPSEIAEMIRTRGVAKATPAVIMTCVLGVLGAAFLALGAVFSITVATDSTFADASSRDKDQACWPSRHGSSDPRDALAC